MKELTVSRLPEKLYVIAQYRGQDYRCVVGDVAIMDLPRSDEIERLSFGVRIEESQGNGPNGIGRCDVDLGPALHIVPSAQEKEAA
jgi:hypothetical protein